MMQHVNRKDGATVEKQLCKAPSVSSYTESDHIWLPRLDLQKIKTYVFYQMNKIGRLRERVSRKEKKGGAGKIKHHDIMDIGRR